MNRQWRSFFLFATTFCAIMPFMIFDENMIREQLRGTVSAGEELQRLTYSGAGGTVDQTDAGAGDLIDVYMDTATGKSASETDASIEDATDEPTAEAAAEISPILHILQYGEPRTATTTQFNMACVSLFLHTQLYNPQLLNNTICNNAGRNYGNLTKIKYFWQNDEIPQVGKSHIGSPPQNIIRNTTVVFTTANSSSEALNKKQELEQQGFHVGLIQDMETVVKAGISGLVKQNVEFFKLKPQHISMMTTYFKSWDKLRQCCGLQMSKYYRNELLSPPDKKDMKQHAFCGSIDIDNLEEKYMETDLYRLLDQYKLVRSINRPSLVDGDLNGTYCSRYNAAVRKHGIKNKGLDGLNSMYDEVENHWKDEIAPTFEGLHHLMQKSKGGSQSAAKLQAEKSSPEPTDSETEKQLSGAKLHQTDDLVVESVFSPWVQDYISFHKLSIENGRLKDDAKYIIYSCKDGNVVCGGVGDRVIGMIKMFYLALMTRRVLVIDADFPIPIITIFEPAHIEWNATYPNTTAHFPDLIWRRDGNNLDLRQNVRGYRILKTGGIPRKLALDDLWLSELMTDHLKQNQWTKLASKMSLSTKAHEAIRAMFNFSPTVISRAAEFKALAGVTGPYIGMHMRKGDAAMGVVIPNAQKNLLIDRTTNNTMMMECWREMKKTHPQVAAAYLASDDVKTKQNMSDSDPSIHFAKEMRPFHVDLLARSNHSSTLKFKPSDPSVAQGVIDTWAEMLVLAQSTCFIVSKSMFSFGSLFLRDPNGCAVFLERCRLPSHRKGYYSYYGEAIYERGFVIVENQTETVSNQTSHELKM